jgi:hypothetical protein
MGLKYHIIPRPQRRQETIASMLVLIWTHVGPILPSPKIARQGYGGRLPLCGISAGLCQLRSNSVVPVMFAARPLFPRKRTWAAFAINYDGNPGQDGRPAGPALQV